MYINLTEPFQLRDLSGNQQEDGIGNAYSWPYEVGKQRSSSRLQLL